MNTHLALFMIPAHSQVSVFSSGLEVEKVRIKDIWEKTKETYYINN